MEGTQLVPSQYTSGLAGFRQANTEQVQDLVSHGYVVVGLDQPYTSAVAVSAKGRIIEGWSKPQIQPLIDQSISPAKIPPRLNGHPLRGGIVPYLAQDIRFTLRQLAALNAKGSGSLLAGHLDMGHTGIFGVSLGAMVAAEASHEDPGLDACLMMDAAMPVDVVRSGLKQPAMWLTRRATDMRLERKRSAGWTEKDIRQTLSTMEDAFAKSRAEGSYDVVIPGMFHINFTDAPRD